MAFFDESWSVYEKNFRRTSVDFALSVQLRYVLDILAYTE